MIDNPPRPRQLHYACGYCGKPTQSRHPFCSEACIAKMQQLNAADEMRRSWSRQAHAAAR